MDQIQLSTELHNELDNLMQQGYKLSMTGDAEGAAFAWLQLWVKVMDTIASYNIQSVDDLDRTFHGLQSFYNWASDYDMELEKLGRKNKEYVQRRIDFNKEYLNRSKNEGEGNSLNMRRAIAESYFALGQVEEGEALFQHDLAEFPTWGWGWIGWSDQYWIMAEEARKDSDRAIGILQQGLKVKGLEDRYDVLERLFDNYADLDRLEEASAVKRQMTDCLKAERMSTSTSPSPTAVPAVRAKIGRNDPCPCGSGFKYKKCCGR